VTTTASLVKRFESCPLGAAGWRQFEDVCIDTLKFLFVPPLIEPIVQGRTHSGIDRRDAIFPNRNDGQQNNNWSRMLRELQARMVLVEFKNYDLEEIGKDEVNQARNYLTKPMGKLAIICSPRLPNRSAHIKRNGIFSEDGKIILFVTVEHLKEMLFIKERGEDPSDLIMDLVERFYIQHE
jgi:hypothetical protein